MINRRLLALAGASALAGWTPAPAIGAPPAYCALYAREYASDTVQPNAAAGILQSIRDQSYDWCLSRDDRPPLPTTSAYAAVDPKTYIAESALAPNEALAQGVNYNIPKPTVRSSHAVPSNDKGLCAVFPRF